MYICMYICLGVCVLASSYNQVPKRLNSGEGFMSKTYPLEKLCNVFLIFCLE